MVTSDILEFGVKSTFYVFSVFLSLLCKKNRFCVSVSALVWPGLGCASSFSLCLHLLLWPSVLFSGDITYTHNLMRNGMCLPRAQETVLLRDTDGYCCCGLLLLLLLLLQLLVVVVLLRVLPDFLLAHDLMLILLLLLLFLLKLLLLLCQINA